MNFRAIAPRFGALSGQQSGAELRDPFKVDSEIAAVHAGLDVQTEVLTPDTIVSARIASAERLKRRPEAGTTKPRKHTVKGVGGPLDLWLFDASTDERPTPCMVWFHGGGYVMGQGRDLWYGQLFAEFAACSVLSVEYRLAPEHRAPAPAEDGMVALEWLTTNAGKLGVDVARIAIGGASAGAGVAAGLAIMNHDTGGAQLALQMLLYPMLDRTHETSRGLTANHPIWWRDQSMSCWSMYLGPNPEPQTLAYAAAAEATSLEGLPPARLFVGTADLFHDEVEAYHRRLIHSGVDSRFRSYPGMIHGGEVAGSGTEIGRRMCQDYIDAVAETLRTRASRFSRR